MTTLLLLRLILFFLGMLPAILFPLMYHLTTHGAWKRSEVGRSAMLLGAALALLYSTSALTLWVPFAVAVSIRVPVLGFLAAALWLQVYSLWRVQVTRRKDRK